MRTQNLGSRGSNPNAPHDVSLDKTFFTTGKRPFYLAAALGVAATAWLAGVQNSRMSKVESMQSQNRLPLEANPKQIEKLIEKLSESSVSVREQSIPHILQSIRALPENGQKLELSFALAEVGTADGFETAQLQQIGELLNSSLEKNPKYDSPKLPQKPNDPYDMLVRMAEYWHVTLPTDAPRYMASKNRLDAMKLEIGKKDFKLKDFSGRTWTKDSLRGKVALMSFWHTGCIPCVKELPDLNKLVDTLDKDHVVLNVTAAEPDDVKGFMKKRTIKGVVLFDDHNWTTHKALEVDQLPRTYVFDRDGNLTGIGFGRQSESQLRTLLKTANRPLLR